MRFVSDWKTGDFIFIVLWLQSAMFALGVLETYSISFPIAEQLLGFLYLTFLPGILFLRLLKLGKQSIVQEILYCVGLSLSFHMFLGLLLNFILPSFGILRPLSQLHIVITTGGVVVLLCILCYLHERDSTNLRRADSITNYKKPLSIKYSAFSLIPFLAVGGSLIATIFGSNLILLLLFVVISVVVFSVKFMDQRALPLVMFTIALALLLHFSLISPNLLGWDIHYETYFAISAQRGLFWDHTIYHNYNSALSISILAVVFSQFMNLDITWVFKIAYPLIFSLVPLGLFEAYRKQLPPRKAFLAVFFFMSLYTFYTEMVSLARQEIAEFFLVLLILTISEGKFQSKKIPLILVFLASLVVSHYSLSFLIMLYLLLSIFISFLTSNSFLKNSTNKVVKSLRSIFQEPKRVLTLTLILFFLVFMFSWYINISQGIVFESLKNVLITTINSIRFEFLNLGAREGRILRAVGLGSGIIQREGIFQVVQWTTFLFIAIGVVRLILRKEEMRFTKEFASMALISACLIGATIILPRSSLFLNMSRTYHFTLLFLSPLCILGGQIAINRTLMLSQRFFGKRMKKYALAKRASIVLLSIVLVSYFLLNSGFVYEVTGDEPGSLPLSLERMKTWKGAQISVWFWSVYVSQEEVASTSWLSTNRNSTYNLYSDLISGNNFLISYGLIPRNEINIISNNSIIDSSHSYIYLNHLNVMNGFISGPRFFSEFWNTSDISGILDQKNCLYSNGFTGIFS